MRAPEVREDEREQHRADAREDERTIEAGPASPARTAGSVKMPEPTMLPTTSAVAIQRPIDRAGRRMP